MSYYTCFLDEKALITILKVINLNKDFQEKILDKIIEPLVQEQQSIHDYSHIDSDEDDYWPYSDDNDYWPYEYDDDYHTD